MNIKKYIIIFLAYIFLFVCGFFAPVLYKQSPLARFIDGFAVRPASVCAAPQKVDIQIVSNETCNEDFPLMSESETNRMVRLLTVNKELEAKLSEAVDMAEYMNRNSDKTKDLVLSVPPNVYDQNLEAIISKIIAGSDEKISDLTAKKYAKWFVQYSKQYNVHPLLSVAVGWKESRFHAASVSCAGARGIMQLMPLTAREVGVVDRGDPEQSIRGGVKYLHNQLDNFHNLKLALAAYNAGPAAIKNNGRVFPLPRGYQQTNYYVPNVEDFLRKHLKTVGADQRSLSNFHFWFST